jgi:hypothetical protein
VKSISKVRKKSNRERKASRLKRGFFRSPGRDMQRVWYTYWPSLSVGLVEPNFSLEVLNAASAHCPSSSSTVWL